MRLRVLAEAKTGENWIYFGGYQVGKKQSAVLQYRQALLCREPSPPAQCPQGCTAGGQHADSIQFPHLAEIRSFNPALLGAEVSCTIVFVLK